MIIIAHRGNLYGPDPRENSPAAIYTAIKKGFHVEVDVISDEGNPKLGHDKPQYDIPDRLWNDSDYHEKIIWHAKDIESLTWALHHNKHCFGHSNDDFVCTSKGYVWTCHQDVLGDRIIIMSPEVPLLSIEALPHGVCTDHPCRMKDFIDHNY